MAKDAWKVTTNAKIWYQTLNIERTGKLVLFCYKIFVKLAMKGIETFSNGKDIVKHLDDQPYLSDFVTLCQPAQTKYLGCLDDQYNSSCKYWK